MQNANSFNLFIFFPLLLQMLLFINFIFKGPERAPTGRRTQSTPTTVLCGEHQSTADWEPAKRQWKPVTTHAQWGEEVSEREREIEKVGKEIKGEWERKILKGGEGDGRRERREGGN